MTSGLEMQMRLEDVDAIVIEELERLGNKYPGKQTLKLNVSCRFEDRIISLEMMSRKYSVDVNDQLMKELKDLRRV